MEVIERSLPPIEEKDCENQFPSKSQHILVAKLLRFRVL
jgi:hypothetical protein